MIYLEVLHYATISLESRIHARFALFPGAGFHPSMTLYDCLVDSPDFVCFSSCSNSPLTCQPLLFIYQTCIKKHWAMGNLIHTADYTIICASTYNLICTTLLFILHVLCENLTTSTQKCLVIHELLHSNFVDLGESHSFAITLRFIKKFEKFSGVYQAVRAC